MGRRAKKAPVQTKKRPTLAKTFKCPFCANENVVECKMDFRNGVGSLECRLCGASFQMPIHHLHEPIDVFSEWLDECEAVQAGRATGNDAQPPPEEEEDSDDDVLPPPSGLGSANVQSASRPQGGQERDNPNKNIAPEPQADYSALGLDDSDDDSDDE